MIFFVLLFSIKGVKFFNYFDRKRIIKLHTDILKSALSHLYSSGDHVFAQRFIIMIVEYRDYGSNIISGHYFSQLLHVVFSFRKKEILVIIL